VLFHRKLFYKRRNISPQVWDATTYYFAKVNEEKNVASEPSKTTPEEPKMLTN
jgi:hypothetical protein